jgi:hypothetical protein
MVCIAKASNDQIARNHFMLPQMFEIFHGDVSGVAILEMCGSNIA